MPIYNLVRLKTLQERNEHEIKTHSYIFCEICGREITKGREGFCVNSFYGKPTCEYCQRGTFYYMQCWFTNSEQSKKHIKWRKPYEFMCDEQRETAALQVLSNSLRRQIRIRSRAL